MDSVVPVQIGTRTVCFEFLWLVIAEAGINHNGSLDMALVDGAAKAAADKH